jgi:DNA-directed RNA polymerase beta' subunit
MWEILQLYGIEATVQFLHMEFAKIISVSKRHLDVLIDWMTSTGTLASVSRYGVDIAKVGPMAKASFEQPLEAFFEAAHTAQRDEITGVSAAVATGVLANGGTGGFNVLLKTKSLPAYEEVQKPKLTSHILKTKVIEHYEEEKLEDIEIPQDEFIIEEEPDEDEEVLGYD